jgi:hypothetical protein
MLQRAVRHLKALHLGLGVAVIPLQWIDLDVALENAGIRAAVKEAGHVRKAVGTCDPVISYLIRRQYFAEDIAFGLRCECQRQLKTTVILGQADRFDGRLC